MSLLKGQRCGSLSSLDVGKLPQTNLETGLKSEEVQGRLAKYGYNEISEKRTSFSVRLGKRFWGVVPWMLELTAIITWFLGKYPDTMIIVGLLVFNAAVSLLRERKARSAMAALKQRLRIESRVRRDRKWTTVPARELVPGDLVRLRAGDLVPADVNIDNGDLEVDQSALTGESENVGKPAGSVVYSGSAVKRGEATGIVTATGAQTYFGRTVELLELSKPKLHMEEIVVKVTRRLAMMILVALLVAFSYALLTGMQLAVLIPLTAILLVATVPVAMPTMFTLNMALGSSELAKKGVLVTRLSASEDAAAMDVLCADKTGTMTQNKLFVSEQLPVNGYRREDVILYGALASNEANHDPIDQAFLAAAKDETIPLDGHSQAEFAPFDPSTRMTRAVIQRDGERFLVVKGSLNATIRFCHLTDGEIATLNGEAEALSARGLRVIAVAQGMDEARLQLVGLAGVADKVRDDSHQTVAQLKDLGVSVKMLTGDSLPIAKNIAKQIGLNDKISKMPEPKGAENHACSLGRTIEDSTGLAEIYPEDKYFVVKSLQEGGHIVGMTGDGVNDAPALNQAEVGIAVRNATDIAKDSASAVLTTEGLGGIVAIIMTGRAIYQRIFSWVLNMITKKTHLVGYVVVMLLLTHYFVISIFAMVLLLFLGDFATMSISTDNVKSSIKPDSFNVSWLFRVAIPLGVLSIIEGIALTFLGFSYFGLSADINRLYTFAFAYLALTALFTLLSVRERSRFWKSKPSNPMLIMTALEVLIIFAISSLGFWELAPLSFIPLLAITAFVLTVTFIVNDWVKVHLIGNVINPNPQFRSMSGSIDQLGDC
jgi:H+-transporting ATPase